MSDRGVARIHPWIVTAAVLGVWAFFGVFTVTGGEPIAYRAVISVISFLALLLLGAWFRALYVVGMSASGRLSNGLTELTFFAPAFGLSINKMLANAGGPAPLQLVSALALFIGGFSYIYGVWKAAEALEYGDAQGRPVTISTTFGTFLFLYFVFVGAWLIRPRVLRLTAV